MGRIGFVVECIPCTILILDKVKELKRAELVVSANTSSTELHDDPEFLLDNE